MTLFFINLHARQDFPTTERTKPYPLTWLTHGQKNLSVANSAKNVQYQARALHRCQPPLDIFTSQISL
jgi:hypothetical protein